jgi:hypothetical protein
MCTKFLIPEKNNGQKVCFIGNLKRLVEKWLKSMTWIKYRHSSSMHLFHCVIILLTTFTGNKYKTTKNVPLKPALEPSFIALSFCCVGLNNRTDCCKYHIYFSILSVFLLLYGRYSILSAGVNEMHGDY